MNWINKLLIPIMLALLCLLGYTYVHTSTLLARYVSPWWVGWLAGLGIEWVVVLTTLTIAWGKGRHKRDFMLGFGLIFTLFVSAMANVMEGYFTSTGRFLTLSQVTEIDPIQGITWLLATAMISFLVFLVSEIVGVRLREQREAQDAAQALNRQQEREDNAVIAELRAKVVDLQTPVKRLPAISIWPEANRAVVYYVQGDSVDAIKIGKAQDLVRRAKELQVGIALPIVVAAWEYGEHETATHKAFAKHRLRGEWFALSDELRAHIAKVAASALLEAQPEIVEVAESVLPVFSCIYCPAQFKTQNALSAHARIHSDKKRAGLRNGAKQTRAREWEGT